MAAPFIGDFKNPTDAELEDGKRVPHLAIVGAGIAGIATAIRLKKAGYQNFTIFEKASSVGGTWRDNTYPGCGADVAAHFYSLSTDLNPNWTEKYPSQNELREYWEGLWRRYRLEEHTRLNTSVQGAKWDAERQIYTIDLVNVVGGYEVPGRFEAEVMIYAVGVYQGPRMPEGLGDLSSFKGEMFHSARWRHDIDLRGKRVGVIGNGCSAAQFVPAISEDPSVQVINFSRTPQWYMSRSNYRYPGWLKWVFSHIPGVMRTYRNLLMANTDVKALLFDKNNSFILKQVRKRLVHKIKTDAPEKYHDQLVPSYDPGCKRIILDPGYLDCLHRPNVSLTFDSIESIVEDGVKTKNGEVIPLDVIIFGTGFTVEAIEVNAVGSEGITVRDYFKQKGVPTAYRGVCYPGFPNLYTLLGPNSAVGHSSVHFCEEVQIDYALQLVKPVLDGKAKSFEVTPEATDEYNNWLQRRLSHSVWTDCHSFYNEVDGKKTKVFVNFPGPVSLFWWICRSPRWSEFRAIGADAWEAQRRWNEFGQWVKWVVLSLLVIGVALGLRNL